jgi:hypothetical protein
MTIEQLHSRDDIVDRAEAGRDFAVREESIG